jgi:hypothetical protein
VITVQSITQQFKNNLKTNKMDLSQLSVKQLDLMYAALPYKSPTKDDVGAEIEKRVEAGEINHSDADECRAMVSTQSSTITKALQTLQL